MRRADGHPEDQACCQAFWPQDTLLAELPQLAGTRWVIETGLQQSKAIGLDQYEERRWEGRHRHIMLCLLAHACLAVTARRPPQ